MHQPVMLEEALMWLAIQPNGIYVDGTVGGGGHSRAILQRLGAAGRLIGIDCDPRAIERQAPDPRATWLVGNFRHLGALLAQARASQVHGVLLDLGVSSYHLDDPGRGFSYRQEGPLDMRLGS